jgi:hypothetical protein
LPRNDQFTSSIHKKGNVYQFTRYR